MSPRTTTTIGVPKELKSRFQKLKKSGSYKSFSIFCNIAIIEKIEREEREG